jgi:hypothetical protein
MCCKGKNKQGQYRPWECVVCFYPYNTFPWSVLPLFIFTFTTHSHGLYCPCLFLPLQHIPMAIQTMGMCCKGENKQGQYKPWECVVKVRTDKGNTDHGNVL